MSDWAECPNCGEEVRGDWVNFGGRWDGPEAQRPYVVPRYTDFHFTQCEGSFESGAAVALGLMWMAFEIGKRGEAMVEKKLARMGVLEEAYVRAAAGETLRVGDIVMAPWPGEQTGREANIVIVDDDLKSIGPVVIGARPELPWVCMLCGCEANEQAKCYMPRCMGGDAHEWRERT